MGMDINPIAGFIYTWIFQVCKFVPFHRKKPYQKAEILHIWKIQLYPSIEGLIEFP